MPSRAAMFQIGQPEDVPASKIQVKLAQRELAQENGRSLANAAASCFSKREVGKIRAVLRWVFAVTSNKVHKFFPHRLRNALAIFLNLFFFLKKEKKQQLTNTYHYDATI